MLIVSLFFSQLVLSDSYIWEISCDKNMMTMNRCSSEKLTHYETQLEIVYEEQLNYLNTEKYKAYFVKSQNAWKNYRDQACTYSAGKREDSGSIWPLAMNGCKSHHTKIRIEEIKKYLNCRDNGCPW
jgi:uncharacterized protein YecT (DUF1311 family)